MGDLAAAAVTLSHLGLAFRTRPSLPPPCPSPPARSLPMRAQEPKRRRRRAALLWLSAGDVTGSELAHTRNAHTRPGHSRDSTSSGKSHRSSSGRGTPGERLGSRAEARAGLRAFGQRSCAAKHLFEESAHRTHTHTHTHAQTHSSPSIHIRDVPPPSSPSAPPSAPCGHHPSPPSSSSSTAPPLLLSPPKHALIPTMIPDPLISPYRPRPRPVLSFPPRPAPFAQPTLTRPALPLASLDRVAIPRPRVLQHSAPSSVSPPLPSRRAARTAADLPLPPHRRAHAHNISTRTDPPPPRP
ncbi:hypothetical protein HETIRDRAFT_454636 [Heterobasidion irregulare TC 32-1]|uniref:Uncharacterized protein n=1 Tax=Heterobasidion irregulare (strain TC 32-1) TaxID=747525 RepID=W4JV13_HETIT|nr:uncharacterized protein HETIRDRAFT_454636 [Heterobasidion irregulare TC 32-1]ETW77299.1 hypothetical protein HETIRDRAFT_454636 [Heterobasidion irregulare TC 32-1]